MSETNRAELAAALGRPEIDFALLADRAEAISNKLYIMGGAWDTTLVVNFAQPAQITLAIGVLIPWHEANTPHQLIVHIESADAARVTPELQASLIVGRPPTAIAGQPFRVCLTVGSNVTFPGPGSYVAVIRLVNGDSKRVVFHAVQAQAHMAVPNAGQA